MINSGLPLVQALDILGKQSENKALQEVTKQVVYDVESGHTVADALRKHPKAFTDLYVNMVAAGEAGGILDTILMRLATFMEKNDALIRKVKGAMIYSAVIMSVAAIAIVVLLDLRHPGVREHVRDREPGAAAPDARRDRALGIPEGLLVGVLIGGLRTRLGRAALVQRRPVGQLKLDTVLLHMPVLGDVLRKSAVSRFTRTLGTLISSGVSILDGLEITAKTAGNRVIHDAIMSSRASIAGGDTISAPLQKSKVFPPMVISMIAVGEQTGGLDEMLTKIADFYDEEVDAAVGGLLSLMEPVMIVFLGVVVGGMVVAMYLPIFDMINAVQ